MDLVDDGPAGAGMVLVFGPVAALDQVVACLIECGVLTDAEPVMSDTDNPDRGSCVLHVPEQGRVNNTGRAGQLGLVPAGILKTVFGLWRGSSGASGRPSGRHRASAGG
ncbi:hypothetical protein GCM10023205_78780 [Yinghuangia aomiensis]|uniref:Uncharacterized protein n=1 Tax=Yinghuangia aomiensis TaxID=676205 RepID=A0ABP9IDH5_9ACTN